MALVVVVVREEHVQVEELKESLADEVLNSGAERSEDARLGARAGGVKLVIHQGEVDAEVTGHGLMVTGDSLRMQRCLERRTSRGASNVYRLESCSGRSLAGGVVQVVCGTCTSRC